MRAPYETHAGWVRIRRELLRLKKRGLPIETLDRNRKNDVVEVGSDYIIVRRDTGNTERISRNQIQGGTKWPRSVTRAIRLLAID